jgi:hypothetical protein
MCSKTRWLARTCCAPLCSRRPRGLLLVDFADLTLAMLLVHAFTFDGAFISPRRLARTAA